MSLFNNCEDKPYPPCCKPAFDFVQDSHILVAEDCDKLKSQFGQSIALSADGRILVVGAPVLAKDGASNYGAAFVYERQRPLGAAVKTPQYKLLQKLDADAGNAGLMGYRVAISGNGQRIAVSAITRVYPSMEPTPTSGVIFIFDLSCKNGKSNYVSVQRLFAQTFDGDDIVLDNPGPNTGNFGEAIALSFDGRVIVSAISPVNSPFGKVYIYEDTTCTILKTGCCVKPEPQPLFVFRQNMDRAKLLTDSGIISILGVAQSITVDGNGNTIAIGCKEAEASSGRVLVYKRLSGDVTWNWNQTLASPTPSSGGRFGVSLDITADGSRLVVENNDNLVNPPRGYGVVFYREDATSSYELEAVLPGVAPDFNFLNAFDVQIAISENGCIVAIGYEGTACLSQNNCGDVVTYERKCTVDGDNTTSQWTQRQRFFEPTLRPEHRFGFAVALDGKGLTMAIGSPGPLPTGQIGKVYTYRAPTTAN